MLTLRKDYFTPCVYCHYSFEYIPLDPVKYYMCQRKYQRWRYWMLLVLQKINKLKCWQPEMPQEAVSFLYSRTAFKPWTFLQQDGRARKGWNKILNEKKIFLASTSKHFYPGVLFTHLVAQQGQETPLTSVCAAIPKGRQRMGPCLPEVQTFLWGNYQCL